MSACEEIAHLRRTLAGLRHAKSIAVAMRDEPEWQCLRGRLAVASVLDQLDEWMGLFRAKLRRFGIVEPAAEAAPAAAGTGGAADGDGR